jgi:hypothetical protein
MAFLLALHVANRMISLSVDYGYFMEHHVAPEKNPLKMVGMKRANWRAKP